MLRAVDRNSRSKHVAASQDWQTTRHLGSLSHWTRVFAVRRSRTRHGTRSLVAMSENGWWHDGQAKFWMRRAAERWLERMIGVTMAKKGKHSVTMMISMTFRSTVIPCHTMPGSPIGGVRQKKFLRHRPERSGRCLNNVKLDQCQTTLPKMEACYENHVQTTGNHLVSVQISRRRGNRAKHWNETQPNGQLTTPQLP